MKANKLMELRAKLRKIKGLNGLDAKFIVKENLIELDSKLKPVDDEEKAIWDIIKDYLNARRITQNKYAKLENGKIKVNEQTREFEYSEKNLPLLEKDIEELKKKYKKEIAEYEKKAIDFDKFLSEKEIEFKKIMIPKTALDKYDSEITDDNFENIFDLIDKSK